MEALTPREIQTRIRSGQSLSDVVKLAGMSADRVEAFAAPVLAEREHIAALALASPVRRAGEPSSHRGLRQVVAERLLSRGLDIDQVEWDAWRRSDARWIAEARYQSGGAKHVARFIFDNHGRFSVADDDEARWLIGDPSASHGPQSGRRRDADDSEPTVDLASPASPVPTVDSDSDSADDFGDFGFDGEPELTPPDSWAADGLEHSHPLVTPSWLDVPESQLAAAEETLEPGHRSTLDSLYDMISVIEEDSVKIYRGLREPLPGFGEAEFEVPASPASAASAAGAASVPATAPAVTPAAPASPVTADTAAEKPEKTGKIVPLNPAPKRRSSKRARASVPSWDEIMFGGPPPAS
ncbi:MAG: DUF3071 domain-containing protein [Propionibacteriaceae bacterium]|jgi:hypothetical protein|nr:DUF3071 domain-containing protein [Propionibacteriaceae bacterium]